MSNGSGFTPKTQDAWQTAGNANLAKSGISWKDVLDYIDQQQAHSSGGEQDNQLRYVTIPGMGTFSVNWGNTGKGPDSPYGVIGIAREGGGTENGKGDDGGLYPDTMVGYRPGDDGKIEPYSYGINKSEGPLAAYIATVLSMGTLAPYLAGGEAVGAGLGSVGGAGYAIPTSAELGAGGFGTGGMGLTGAGGIGSAPSLVEAGLGGSAGYGAAGAGAFSGIDGVDPFQNETAKLAGQGGEGSNFWNTELPYQPTTPGIDGVDPYQNETEKFARQNSMEPGSFWNTNLPFQPTNPGSLSLPPGTNSLLNAATKALTGSGTSAYKNNTPGSEVYSKTQKKNGALTQLNNARAAEYRNWENFVSPGLE